MWRLLGNLLVLSSYEDCGFRVGNEILFQARAMLTRCSMEVFGWEAGNVVECSMATRGFDGLYIPAVYEQTTPQKTSFKGDLQGTRVADPRLEAMALEPPIGLRSRCVPSEILDRGSSKLPNLGRGSCKSGKWLTGRALTWWMGSCLPCYAVFD